MSEQEREAYEAMLREERNDEWMGRQSGRVIGPRAFAQRFRHQSVSRLSARRV